MGVDVLLASGEFDTFASALKYRDDKFARSKKAKKVVDEEEEEGYDEEVEFVAEKTRLERDEEGKANAILVEE